MRLVSSYQLVALSAGLLVTSSCKIVSPEQKSVRDESPTSMQQGADKESESVVGIPGYRMNCDFAEIPTSLEPAADLGCKIEGAPAKERIQWTIDRPDQEELITLQSLGQEIQLIPIDTGNRDLSLDVATRTMIKAQLSDGTEISAIGRHLLMAKPAEYRLGARCDALFSVLLTDEESLFVKGEVSRFTNCEKLAQALHQKTLSKNASASLPPEPGPTVQASCDATENVTIAIQTPELTASQSFGPIDPNACLQLVRLIHETKI
ncbi:MAG: hypothetical protein ACOH5I_22520 [Oligoflexus sp.]